MTDRRGSRKAAATKKHQGGVAVSREERGMDTAWMPLLGPVKSCLPFGIAFLVIQGVSELLKSVHAARAGRWPQ